MSCLEVILQVRGRDGMSTPQNGAAVYSQFHVSPICHGGFSVASPPVFVFLGVPYMVGPP